MTDPDLAEIVEGTVVVMLGLDLGELVQGTEPTACEIGAVVQFAGQWEGAVVVGCDARFGREVAAAMFASEPDAVDPDDVADALGELANMIGGNVKPLLPATADISLPTVVQGADVRLDVPGAVVWVGVVYRRGGSELSVRIFERALPGEEPS